MDWFDKELNNIKDRNAGLPANEKTIYSKKYKIVSRLLLIFGSLIIFSAAIGTVGVIISILYVAMTGTIPNWFVLGGPLGLLIGGILLNLGIERIKKEK